MKTFLSFSQYIFSYPITGIIPLILTYGIMRDNPYQLYAKQTMHYGIFCISLAGTKTAWAMSQVIGSVNNNINCGNQSTKCFFHQNNLIKGDLLNLVLFRPTVSSELLSPYGTYASVMFPLNCTWVLLFCIMKCINSLIQGSCGCNFQSAIFKHISFMNIMSILRKIPVKWMQQVHIDNKSTLVQVMVWCHQAPSYCMNPCWPSFMIWCHWTTMS